jgi:hypothetical protein
MNWKLYSEDKPPLNVDVMIVTLHDPQMTWEGQFKDHMIIVIVIRFVAVIFNHLI